MNFFWSGTEKQQKSYFSSLFPKQQHRFVIIFGDTAKVKLDGKSGRIDSFFPTGMILPPWFIKSVDKPSFEIGTIPVKYLFSHTFNFPKRMTWKPITMSFHDVYVKSESVAAVSDSIAKAEKIITDAIEKVKKSGRFAKNETPDFATVLNEALLGDKLNSVFLKESGLFSDDKGSAAQLFANIEKAYPRSTQLIFYKFLNLIGYTNPSETSGITEDNMLRLKNYHFKRNMVKAWTTPDPVGKTNIDLLKENSIEGQPNSFQKFCFSICEIDNDGYIIEQWKIHNPLVSEIKSDKLDYSSSNINTINVTINYDWAELVPVDPLAEKKQELKEKFAVLELKYKAAVEQKRLADEKAKRDAELDAVITREAAEFKRAEERKKKAVTALADANKVVTDAEKKLADARTASNNAFDQTVVDAQAEVDAAKRKQIAAQKELDTASEEYTREERQGADAAAAKRTFDTDKDKEIAIAKAKMEGGEVDGTKYPGEIPTKEKEFADEKAKYEKSVDAEQVKKERELQGEAAQLQSVRAEAQAKRVENAEAAAERAGAAAAARQAAAKAIVDDTTKTTAQKTAELALLAAQANADAAATADAVSIGSSASKAAALAAAKDLSEKTAEATSKLVDETAAGAQAAAARSASTLTEKAAALRAASNLAEQSVAQLETLSKTYPNDAKISEALANARAKAASLSTDANNAERRRDVDNARAAAATRAAEDAARAEASRTTAQTEAGTAATAANARTNFRDASQDVVDSANAVAEAKRQAELARTELAREKSQVAADIALLTAERDKIVDKQSDTAETKAANEDKRQHLNEELGKLLKKEEILTEALAEEDARIKSEVGKAQASVEKAEGDLARGRAAVVDAGKAEALQSVADQEAAAQATRDVRDTKLREVAEKSVAATEAERERAALQRVLDSGKVGETEAAASAAAAAARAKEADLEAKVDAAGQARSAAVAAQADIDATKAAADQARAAATAARAAAGDTNLTEEARREKEREAVRLEQAAAAAEQKRDAAPGIAAAKAEEARKAEEKIAPAEQAAALARKAEGDAEVEAAKKRDESDRAAAQIAEKRAAAEAKRIELRDKELESSRAREEAARIEAEKAKEEARIAAEAAYAATRSAEQSGTDKEKTDARVAREKAAEAKRKAAEAEGRYAESKRIEGEERASIDREERALQESRQESRFGIELIGGQKSEAERTAAKDAAAERERAASEAAAERRAEARKAAANAEAARLSRQAAAESDPAKRAEIQARADKAAERAVAAERQRSDLAASRSTRNTRTGQANGQPQRR